MTKVTEFKLNRRYNKKQKVGWNIDELNNHEMRKKYEETISKKIQDRQKNKTKIEGK